MGKNEALPIVTRYQRLAEISRNLASTLNLDELLLRIVEAAAAICNAQAASILLYDESKGELRFEVATNMDDPLLRGISVPVDSSIAGWIVTQCKPIIISDAQKDERHYGQVGESTNMITRSLVGVPLVTKDKVIGALEAINKQEGEFTLEDQDLMLALGAQAAVAIENSRLFQQSDHIAELVHELRTPMASLNTAVHLLTRPGTSDEQRHKIFAMVRSEIERLSELTTAFLDMSRLESGRATFHTEQFDLRGLLVECAEVMRNRAEEKQIAVILDLPEVLPAVTADRDKIKQVVLNLLSNAVKYNYPNGSVILKGEHRLDTIVFAVTDTGPGITPEAMQRLFEKFYRVPGTEKLAPGTGLGLSICKKIVEMHGGVIQVTSEVGKGTSFSVLLPTNRAKST